MDFFQLNVCCVEKTHAGLLSALRVENLEYECFGLVIIEKYSAFDDLILGIQLVISRNLNRDHSATHIESC